VTEVSDRVGRLCAMMGQSDIWPACTDAGADEALRMIVAAVSGDLPHSQAKPTTEDLVNALDIFDGTMARAGYGHPTRSRRIYHRPPGIANFRRIDAWVCPAVSRCSRVVVERGEVDVSCTITGRAFERIRLQ